MNGPDIRRLISMDDFCAFLSPDQFAVWNKIINVIENFLGNKRSQNYKDIVQDMINSLKLIGVNMSLKIYFLKDHLDDFPPNCGDYSEEMGEKFHQDIKSMEDRYDGKNLCHMLGEYCWFLCRDKESQTNKKPNKATYDHTD